MNLLRFQRRYTMEAILFVFSAWAITLHAQQAGTVLVFYAQPRVSEDMWQPLFQILQADLYDQAELPKGIALDQNAAFVRGSDALRGLTFSRIISVKLLGRCDVLPQINRPSLNGPLGWVMMVSGKIQPFVSIDCTRIAQVLRPAVPGLNKQERQDVMLQAIAHVLIHEWSHIASQSPAHTPRGVTQAELSLHELIAAPKSAHLAAIRH
jgi:hypothetical protein